jgi:SAM-dependent methyltransferase
MLGSVLGKLLNLKQLLIHAFKKTDRARQWDPAQDIDLRLYAKIFNNDHMHYGYFKTITDDPEKISLHDIKQAMEDYSNLIMERVRSRQNVLDAGCGTGGLLKKLKAHGVSCTGLTPNLLQYQHLQQRNPDIPVFHCGFEQLEASLCKEKFGAIIMSESFQYMDMENAARKVKEVLKPGGEWIVVDYFRLGEDARNTSGHPLSSFRDMLARWGFVIREEKDITDNILPNLNYLHHFARTVGIPLIEHTIDKLRIRKPLVGYLFGDVLTQAKDRIKLDTLDPEVFRKDKKYILFRLGCDT